MSEQKYRMLDESDVCKPIPEGAEYFYKNQWIESECIGDTFLSETIGQYRVPITEQPTAWPARVTIATLCVVLLIAWHNLLSAILVLKSAVRDGK